MPTLPMEDNDAPSGLPRRGGTKLDLEGVGLGKRADTALGAPPEQKWPRAGEAT